MSVQETEKEFAISQDKSFGGYNTERYPENLIRYASDYQMTQKQLNVGKEERNYAISLIETAIRNTFDEESAKKIVGLFNGTLKWSDIKKPFDFHEFLKRAFKGALGMKSDREQILAEASVEEKILYDELREAFIKAHIALNNEKKPYAILHLLEIYPEIAICISKLEATLEFLGQISKEEKGRDVVNEVAELAIDPVRPKIDREDVKYVNELFDRYSYTRIMDPEESIASYARFLEKQTKMQMDIIAVCIENLEKRIQEALGPDAKIKVYGKTPIEREETEGHITIKAAAKVDFHNDKTPSGVPIPDAMVTLF